MRESVKDYKTMYRKYVGYFGWRYECYLEEEHPEAFRKLKKREDRSVILNKIHNTCQIQMAVMMDMLGGDKRMMNSHKSSGEFDKMIRKAIVSRAEDAVFRNTLDVLEYASWMVG